MVSIGACVRLKLATSTVIVTQCLLSCFRVLTSPMSAYQLACVHLSFPFHCTAVNFTVSEVMVSGGSRVFFDGNAETASRQLTFTDPGVEDTTSFRVFLRVTVLMRGYSKSHRHYYQATT